MAAQIPPPNPQELLPPLLACLPLSAFSSRPPPALPALLTPILRQRLHVLSSGPTSANSSWLPLLNWNRDEGAKLPDLVNDMNFEPHPVSGELEIEDVEEIQYRRLDEETLHTRLKLEQYGLLVTYLWCMGEGNNSAKTWLLSELKCLEANEDDTMWSSSMQEAENAVKQRSKQPTAKKNTGMGKKSDAEESDDDAYWAAYDSTPGRTPAKRSPAPGNLVNGGLFQRVSSSNELEYFNRYGSEVQPAMDPYDPAEDVAAKSTLNHHSHEFVNATTAEDDDETPDHTLLGNDSVFEELHIENPAELVISVPDTPHHPRPMSVSSGSSVEKLEEEAERTEHQAQAEVGIKQHISTDIKSLYRLSRSVGISREEFGRIVRTELELLQLMDLE
jgi:hypothetical protein